MGFPNPDPTLGPWKHLMQYVQQMYQYLKLFRDGPLELPGPLTITNRKTNLFPPTQIKTGSTEFPTNYPTDTPTTDGPLADEPQPILILRDGPQQPPVNDPTNPTNPSKPQGETGPAERPREQDDTDKDGDPIIRVERKDGSATDYHFKPTGITPTDATTGEDTSEETSAAGGGIPAKVTGGSGTSPTVALYEQGVAGGVTQSVTATVLQLASGESFPTDTWGFASQVGGVWYFNAQGGIWL